MRHLIAVLGLILHVNRCSLALLIRHLIVFLRLILHINRCLLANATGPFSSNGSFCLVQRKRPGKPSRESLLQDLTQSAECLLHCELEELVNHLDHLEHVAIQKCNFVSTAIRWWGALDFVTAATHSQTHTGEISGAKGK